MANKSFIYGMMDCPQGSEAPDIMWLPKKVSSAAIMFINSPCVAKAGYVDTVASGHTNLATNGITGTVKHLLDSNGTPVTNLAAASAGTVGFTYAPGLRYRMLCDTTEYVDTLQGTYVADLTAETGTADTATANGDGFSQRMVDISTNTATTANGQVVLGTRTRQPINSASLAYTEIFVTINSAFYQAPGA